MKVSTSQLIIGGYVVALFVLGVIALLAYRSTRQYIASVTERRQISDRLEHLAHFLSLLKDAETGQRGYLLTNRPEYLAPYSKAAATWQDEYERLRETFADADHERAALDELRRLSRANMEGLARSLELRQANTPESRAALAARLASGEGRLLMEDIRDRVLALEQRQRDAFEAAHERVQSISNTTMAAVTVLAPLALLLVVGALVLILRDLRHKNLAQEALRQQRVLLSAIVDSMNEGVVVADEGGQLVLLNPAAKRLVGTAASPHSAGDWSRSFEVFDADRVTPLPREKLPLVRALAGETVDFLDLYLRPVGSDQGRYVAGTASPLVDEFGIARGAVVILRDVTERRAAERRFQSLLESAPDALVIADQQGVIRLVNAQAERLFGYRRDELVGETVELLVPPQQRAAHPAQRDGYFANPHRRPMGSGLELHGLRADGSAFPIEISLAPVDGAGEPLVCAAIRDVTDRRQAMAKIRQLNDELEHRVSRRTAELAAANEELTQRNQENELFVYSVSHDLRSPLVNLQGFSQELDDACQRLRSLAERPETAPAVRDELTEIVAGDVAESIHFIRTSVLRLSGIIDALLRLSRAGRVVYQWEELEIEVIVRRVIDAAHGTIQERGAEIVVEELPSAWGDFTAVEQVFGNLVQNALHYLSPDRPGRIEIGCCASASTPGFQAYYVRDNGLGIAAEMQGKIFQAFQRLQPKHVPGEGLGLTLVQRIVERHGGRIWVESTPGAGSTFYLTLPTAARQVAADVHPTADAGEHL